MKVAVVGAGAMGSIMACLLHDGGMEVVLYEKREERVADVRLNGIRLRGDLEAHEAMAIKPPGEPAGSFDLIVLAVPAGSEGDALRPLSPFVHRETLYLSLQEGNAVEELVELVGEERAGGAVSRVSAAERQDGEVEVEELRSIRVGGYPSLRGPGFVPLVDAAAAASSGRLGLASDLGWEIGERLAVAAPVSSLCAVLGAAPREIMARPEVDSLCLDAVEEARRVIAAARREDAPGSPWEEAVWMRVKPPLLRQLEEKRASEVDRLPGYVAERARSAGMPAPVHAALTSLVREIGSGRHKPGEAAFRELQRRIGEEKAMGLL